MQFSIDDMLRRQSAMESRRSNWDNLWERAAEKLFPVGNDFRTKRPPGEMRTNKQYDAFPQQALNRYAAAMENGLTPRTTEWHKISTGDPDLDDEDDVKSYLYALNKTLWDTRYSAKANFANQNHEVLLSHGAFGTGVLYTEAHSSGIGCAYRAIHMSQMYLEQDGQGFIDTWHRKVEMTAREIKRKVMDQGWSMPEKVDTALNKGKLDEPFEVLHVVMPREDWDPDRLDEVGMKFMSVYIACDTKEPLSEQGGYREAPYSVARSTTSVNEIYGRGPGIQMLPDIRMLNEMSRTIIEAANMAVDPPTLLHEDGILGEFRLLPGARNYGGVDENGRPRAIPYANGADPRIGMELVMDRRNQIDDAFMGIYFRVLLENPQMTATQAMLIAQQQGQMTSPVIGRLQSEYLDYNIRRESGILFRQGRHPEMPPVLQEYLQAKREPLSIEYVSPMARAAAKGDAVAVQQTIEALTPWAQIAGPSVLSRFDPDEVAKLMAEVNGVPPIVLKTDEAVAEEKAAEAQQMQAQQMIEAAPVMAQSMESIAKAQAMTEAQPANIPGM